MNEVKNVHDQKAQDELNKETQVVIDEINAVLTKHGFVLDSSMVIYSDRAPQSNILIRKAQKKLDTKVNDNAKTE